MRVAQKEKYWKREKEICRIRIIMGNMLNFKDEKQRHLSDIEIKQEKIRTITAHITYGGIFLHSRPDLQIKIILG